MEFLKKNKTAIAIGAGLTSAVGLALYLLSKSEEEENKQVQQQQDGENVEVQVQQIKKKENTQSVEQYQQQLQSIIAQIVVQKDQQNANCIDFQTIAKIMECSVELSKDQFVELTQAQRIDRRKTTGEDYEKLVIQQCDDVENMLNKVQEDIIAGLNVSQQQFEESLMLIIQRGLHQQLIYLDMAVKQQLKMKLSSDKELDLEKAKEIIRYQNEVIETEPDYFQNILKMLVSNPEMQQRLPQIINILLCDKVFVKYQIEEEDIVKMLGPYAQTDAEIQQLMIKAEEGMRNLFTKFAPMGGMQGMM